MRYVLVALLALVLAGGCLNTADQSLSCSVMVSAEAGWSGSGVFVDDDLILTARHVAQDAGQLTITLADGRKFTCGAVRLCEGSDLALIDVATPGRERRMRLASAVLGRGVVHVGAPYQMWPTISRGIVSCLDRDLPEIGKDLIQVDCPGYGPGSSGGPVFDSTGALVGIAIAVGPTNGFDLCVPASQIKEFLDGQR